MDIEATRKIGAVLRSLREEGNIKQCTVAERLRKSQSYISKIEAGEQRLHLYEVFSYADAIEVSPGEMIGAIEKALTGRTSVVPKRTEYSVTSLPDEGEEPQPEGSAQR